MARLDTDHSDQVEGDEFVAALVDWGQVMETSDWAALVDAAFSRLDADGDGFIELDELLARLPQDFLAGCGFFARRGRGRGRAWPVCLGRVVVCVCVCG